MIEIEVKHDVNLKKATGIAVILGVTIGATVVATKECIEYGKNKIKNRKK